MMERMDEEFRALVQKEDPQMHAVIARHPLLHLPLPRPPFEALVRIVAGQQLSVKAAATDVLRGAGLSGAKSRSVMAIADFAGPDGSDLDRLLEAPWHEVRAALLELKGIGPWSVDMYAMFGLGMPDVFSSVYLGVRGAMEPDLTFSPILRLSGYDQRALCWGAYLH